MNSFRKVALCVLTLFFLLTGRNAFAQKRSPLVGKWENPNHDGRIEFKKRGDKYYGKLYWLKNPDHEDGSPKLDENNPDPALRKRRIQGIELIHDMIDKGGGIFEDGYVYEPKTAKDFNCKLILLPDGKLEMHGFIGTPMLGRTEVWSRIN